MTLCQFDPETFAEHRIAVSVMDSTWSQINEAKCSAERRNNLHARSNCLGVPQRVKCRCNKLRRAFDSHSKVDLEIIRGWHGRGMNTSVLHGKQCSNTDTDRHTHTACHTNTEAGTLGVQLQALSFCQYVLVYHRWLCLSFFGQLCSQVLDLQDSPRERGREQH